MKDTALSPARPSQRPEPGPAGVSRVQVAPSRLDHTSLKNCETGICGGTPGGQPCGPWQAGFGMTLKSWPPMTTMRSRCVTAWKYARAGHWPSAVFFQLTPSSRLRQTSLQIVLAPGTGTICGSSGVRPPMTYSRPCSSTAWSPARSVHSVSALVSDQP